MSSRDTEQYVLGENARDINIREFLEVIKRRIWIVVLITIIATMAGYFYSTTLNNALLYQTSTRVIINSDEGYMSTLMVMIKDPIVMEKVKEELKLTRSPESIASQIEVTRVDESKVIRIDVTDQNPEIAMHIANATAKAFKSEAGSILEFKDVQLLSEAKQNDSPINVKNENQIIVISFVAGMIAGIGLVFLIDALDEKVEKASQVEGILDVPVLGVISNMKMRKVATKKGGKKEMGLRRERIGSNE
jgi:capsular polysaccharide biosynthesis protein